MGGQPLFTRNRHYEELSESIGEHLDEKTADLMDVGMTKGQAVQVARLEFGNVTQIEERSRELWQWPTLESMLSDLKYAFRQIGKASGFSAMAIVILALCIVQTRPFSASSMR
jgi:hypothetical protein